MAGAFEGDAVAEVGDPLGVFVHDGVLSGFEPAGGEAIDSDAVDAPVIGEGHGELFGAAAAGSVGCEAGVSGDGGDGADVDDAAVFGGDHRLEGDLLGEEEGTAEVGVEDEVPVVPGDFGGGFADVATGVVDEDVDGACGGDGVFYGGLDAFEGRDIEDDGEGAAAEGFDAGGDGC